MESVAASQVIAGVMPVLSLPDADNHVYRVDQAVVVAGEASESEEEEVDTSQHSNQEPVSPRDDKPRSSSTDLQELPVLISLRAAESRYAKSKYDTLLHKKLRESNWQLYDNMTEVAGQAYVGAARSLTGGTAQLLKLQGVVQDTSHSLRLLTNDLFHLDDHIDIIRCCKLLPDIRIDISSPVSEQVVKHVSPS